MLNKCTRHIGDLPALPSMKRGMPASVQTYRVYLSCGTNMIKGNLAFMNAMAFFIAKHISLGVHFWVKNSIVYSKSESARQTCPA